MKEIEEKLIDIKCRLDTGGKLTIPAAVHDRIRQDLMDIERYRGGQLDKILALLSQSELGIGSIGKSITIEFNGYWRYEHKDDVPAQSGIYCVYRCKYNVQEKTVDLIKLLYIDTADNVRDRISNHDKYNEWLWWLQEGDQLCFSFGVVSATDQLRAKAAMIFKHKPPQDNEFVNSFPFDATKISLSGKVGLLVPTFFVP